MSAIKFTADLNNPKAVRSKIFVVEVLPLIGVVIGACSFGLYVGSQHLINNSDVIVSHNMPYQFADPNARHFSMRSRDKVLVDIDKA